MGRSLDENAYALLRSIFGVRFGACKYLANDAFRENKSRLGLWLRVTSHHRNFMPAESSIAFHRHSRDILEQASTDILTQPEI